MPLGIHVEVIWGLLLEHVAVVAADFGLVGFVVGGTVLAVMRGTCLLHGWQIVVA